MIRTFDKSELPSGSFGEQHTTIDGVKYLDWFHLAGLRLGGLGAGAKVEFESRPGPTFLCHVPQVTRDLPSAVIKRVVGRGTV